MQSLKKRGVSGAPGSPANPKLPSGFSVRSLVLMVEGAHSRTASKDNSAAGVFAAQPASNSAITILVLAQLPIDIAAPPQPAARRADRQPGSKALLARSRELTVQRSHRHSFGR